MFFSEQNDFTQECHFCIVEQQLCQTEFNKDRTNTTVEKHHTHKLSALEREPRS